MLGTKRRFPGLRVPTEKPFTATLPPAPARRAAPKQPVAQPIAAQPSAPLDPSTPVSLEDGKAFYMKTCMACHGMDAKGVPGLGKDMTTSEFIASTGDVELVEFIKRGRAIDDPLRRTSSWRARLVRTRVPSLMTTRRASLIFLMTLFSFCPRVLL